MFYLITKVITINLVKQVIYANVMTMDHYLPAFVAVLEGEQSPEEAITKVESEEDEIAV